MSDLILTSGYSLTLPSGGPAFGVRRPTDKKEFYFFQKEERRI